MVSVREYLPFSIAEPIDAFGETDGQPLHSP
jgi:hypothetical protein